MICQNVWRGSGQIGPDGVLRLVDTGETAAARNVPFARMEVTPEQVTQGERRALELP